MSRLVNKYGPLIGSVEDLAGAIAPSCPTWRVEQAPRPNLRCRVWTGCPEDQSSAAERDRAASDGQAPGRANGLAVAVVGPADRARAARSDPRKKSSFRSNRRRKPNDQREKSL
ncbi:MAG: hypothetical protein HC767_06865 [Akkermansiaceae bacterium]|nr:hypothetical protein [Akkermansiaceae bacterium]